MSPKFLVNVNPYAQPSDSMTSFAKKQKSKLLIGASDMIGARYIPLCSNLIGVRYIPLYMLQESLFFFYRKKKLRIVW